MAKRRAHQEKSPVGTKQKHSKQRRLRVIFGALVLVLVVGLLVLKGSNKEDFVIHKVARHDIASEVQLSGKVKPISRVDLAFEQSGRITEILVKEGDEVQEGDVLIRLQSDALLAQRDDASASVAIKQARLDEVLRGSRPEESAIVEVKAETAGEKLDAIIKEQQQLVAHAYEAFLNNDLRAYAASSASSIQAPLISGNYKKGEEGSLRISFDAPTGGSNYPYVISRLTRGKGKASSSSLSSLADTGLYMTLVAGESYPNTLWDIPIPNTRSSTYLAALATYEKAVSNRDVVIAGAQQEAATTDSERALDAVGSSPEELHIARAELAQANSRVRDISANLRERVLVAPFSGVITNLDVDAGHIALAGEVLATLASVEEFRVEIDVPEVELPRVERDQEVSVTLDAYGDKEVFPAKILVINRVETVIDGINVYQATLGFLNDDERIRSGMTARATILVGKRENIVAIPRHLIQEDDAGKYVDILREGEVLQSKITTGIEGTNGLVEIISGLQEGEAVISPEV